MSLALGWIYFRYLYVASTFEQNIRVYEVLKETNLQLKKVNDIFYLLDNIIPLIILNHLYMLYFFSVIKNDNKVKTNYYTNQIQTRWRRYNRRFGVWSWVLPPLPGLSWTVSKRNKTRFRSPHQETLMYASTTFFSMCMHIHHVG